MNKIVRLRAIKIVCVLALASGAGEAGAQSPSADGSVVGSSITTTMLAMNCQASRTVLDQDFCTGYIAGAFDAMSAARIICPPNSTTTGQVLAVGRKFLRDHPEAWGAHPAVVVQSALQAAFPCRAR